MPTRSILRIMRSVLFPAAMLLAANARAQINWVGGTDTLWNTGANWSGGSAPGATDHAQLGVAVLNAFPYPTLLGASQTVGRITFQDVGALEIGASESFTLTLANLNATGFIIVDNSEVTIHNDIVVTAAQNAGRQTWSNLSYNPVAETGLDFTATGDITLRNSLILTGGTGGGYVFGTEGSPGGSVLLNDSSVAHVNNGLLTERHRFIRVGNTLADVDLTIWSDIHLRQATVNEVTPPPTNGFAGDGNYFQFEILAGARVEIRGNILDGGGPAGLRVYGPGTLDIYGNLAYTRPGTPAGLSGADPAGTVLAGGGITNIYGNINNDAQNWLVSQDNTRLNLYSASITSTGTWTIGGGTGGMHFLRNSAAIDPDTELPLGPTTLTMGIWDMRNNAVITSSDDTILTGNTGAWNFNNSAVTSASNSAHISLARIQNLTTGSWALSGNGTNPKVNIGQATNLTTGAWTLGSTGSQVNIDEATDLTTTGWTLSGSNAQVNIDDLSGTTTTGNWTLSGSNAQVNIDDLSGTTTTGNWTLSGSNAQVNLGNVSGTTTGNWNLTGHNSKVNWTGTGAISIGAITLGSTSLTTTTDTSINLSGTGTITLRDIVADIVPDIVANRNGTHLIDGGTLALNGSRNITVHGSVADEGLEITSAIVNGGPASGITKLGTGTLVLSGANTFTGASMVSNGRLLLDYTSENNSKVANAAMTMQNGTLELRGHATEATTQNIGNLALTGIGASHIVLDPGSAGLTFNIGNITGGANNQAIRFVIPDGASLNTTTATTGFLGTWATYHDGATDHYAAVSGGQIAAAVTTAADDFGRVWSPTLINRNVSDVDGFTGTSDYMSVNSLRISGANDLVVLGRLHLEGGGLLITSDSTATGIEGGILTSGGNNFLITHHGAQEFTIDSQIRGFNNSLTPVTLNKSGEGVLLLSGHNPTGNLSNPYTTSGTNRILQASGAINILEGTLAVSGGNAISDNTTVNLLGSRAVFRLDDDETIGNLVAAQEAIGSVVDLQSHQLTVRLTNATHQFHGSLVGDENSRFIQDNMVAGHSQGVAANLDVRQANDDFHGTIEVNGGLLRLYENASFNNVSTIILNQWGAMMVDSETLGVSSNRIADDAAIILNGARGAAQSNQNQLFGLRLRNTQNQTVNEVVGGLTLRAGSNYYVAEATGGTASSISLTVDSITRENHATLAVRGTRLGTNVTNAQRGYLLITTTGNADEAFGNLFRVGGTFANGATAASTQANPGTATNISIVPWVIGEVHTGGLPATLSPGNSFVTYNASWGSAVNTGFRPLHLTNEYTTYAAAGAQNNVRISATSNQNLGAGKTINSLIVNNQNNSATAISATGTGTLRVHTGAFLFTSVGAVDSIGGAAMNTTSGAITLGGFDAITVGGNEYLFFANNMAAAGTTISSNLTTSGAHLVKSGIGLLQLTGTNTALTGGVTINEGTLRISSLDNIGGASGDITFAGGVLEVTESLNLTGRSLDVLDGTTGALSVSVGKTVTMGALEAGTGVFSKAGLGTLTLTEATVHTGLFIAEHNNDAAQTIGSIQHLILDSSDGPSIGGDLQIGSTNFGSMPSGSHVVVAISDESQQFASDTVIRFNAETNRWAYLWLQGYTQTVAGIQANNGGAIIQNTHASQSLAGSPTGRLILNGDGEYYYGGLIRDYSNGGSVASHGRVALSKAGSGVQTLDGSGITYTGATTITGGTLRLRDTTAFVSTITNDATLEIERTNDTAWTYSQAISGSGDLIKTGTGTGATTFNAANTYTGATTIAAGTLSLGNAGSIDKSRAINIHHGATFNVSAKAAGYTTYEGIVAGNGTVAGNFTLGDGASIRPGASSNPNVDALTGNQLGSLNFTGNLTLNEGSAVILQIGGATYNDAGILAAYAANDLASYFSEHVNAWDDKTYYDADGIARHDYLDIQGEFTWNEGSTITYELAYGYSLTAGDVLNLWDWAGLAAGSYNLAVDGNMQRFGGLAGDLELPDIGGLIYDLSLFKSYGIIVVVPEPSLTLLSTLGLAGLFLRRRRAA